MRRSLYRSGRSKGCGSPAASKSSSRSSSRTRGEPRWSGRRTALPAPQRRRARRSLHRRRAGLSLPTGTDPKARDAGFADRSASSTPAPVRATGTGGGALFDWIVKVRHWAVDARDEHEGRVLVLAGPTRCRPRWFRAIRDDHTCWASCCRQPSRRWLTGGGPNRYPEDRPLRSARWKPDSAPAGTPGRRGFSSSAAHRPPPCPRVAGAPRRGVHAPVEADHEHVEEVGAPADRVDVRAVGCLAAV